MADDDSEAGATDPAWHSPSNDAAELPYTSFRVSSSNVLVHGWGSIEDVLEVLRDIAHTRSRAAQTPVTGSLPRKVQTRDEFDRLARRLRTHQAMVVLRKVFLYKQSRCNVMQEIWIKDKENPDARIDPLKEYAIAHVHQHASVDDVADIDVSTHLESVDAINVRHILDSPGPGTYGCHADNPFHDTWIEPWGNTLFPPQKWQCEKCGQQNWPNKMQCTTSRCGGKQKCTKWEWRRHRNRDSNLSLILEEADKLNDVWVSRSAKEKHRTAGVRDTPSTLEELMKRYKSEPTRGARKDLRKAPVAPPCKECQRSPCHKTCSAWKDLEVAMLCIGISKYSTLMSLPNAARDARALHDRLNELNELGVRCKAEVHADLKTAVELKNCIRNFLQRKELKASPPRGVLIGYSGHGMQKGGNVYLLPGDADPEDESFHPDYDAFPLRDILRFCREDLDEHAAMEKRERVSFVVIVDACRDSAALSDESAIYCSLDQHKKTNPKDWAIYFSCLRDSTASDGTSGENSPFVAELLHGTKGIFAQGVPLHKGLNDVCDRLRKQQSDQFPFGIAEHTIPRDLCLFPASRDHAQVGAAGEAADKDCNELVRFLKDKGLGLVAVQFSKTMGIELVNSLAELHAEDLDAPDLPFLRPIHKRMLMKLVQNIIARSASLRESVLDDRDLSDADTASVGGEMSDMEDDLPVIVAAYNLGNADDVLAHLAYGIFLSADDQGGGKLSLCRVLWLSFLRGATYESTDAERKQMEEWLKKRLAELLENAPICDEELAQKVNSFLSHVVQHKLLDRIREKIGAYPDRPSVGAVAIVDQVVEQLLVEQCRDAERLSKWREHVVGTWYNRQDETANDFLCRANEFLRGHLDKETELLTYVKTHSYVAFLRMTKLASFLLFEYLEARKLECESVAGVTDRSSLYHGFRMFLSSSGRVFSLTEADVPARRAKPIVLRGLRCLSRVSAQAWESLGPMKTAHEYARAPGETVSTVPQLDPQEVEQAPTANFTVQGEKKVDNTANRSWEPKGGWDASFQEILNSLTSQIALSDDQPLPSQVKLSSSEKSDTQMIAQRMKQGHYWRHPEDFHVDALLVFRAEIQSTSLRPKMHEMCAAGSRANANSKFELKCADIWDKIRAVAQSGVSKREEHENVIELYRNRVSAVRQYLEKLDEEVGRYVDSASGEILRVEDETISLTTFPSESIIALCDQDPKALNEDMICPITGEIMRDPVKCIFRDDNGKTPRSYERWAIERYSQVEWQKNAEVPCPWTRRLLKTIEKGGECTLLMQTDKEMLKRIADLRSAKAEKEARRKQEIEGREEQFMELRRRGHEAGSQDSVNGVGIPIESPQALLQRLHEGHTMCVIGQPASGKTLSMQQVACEAAKSVKTFVELQGQGSSAEGSLGSPRAAACPTNRSPLMPVFVRAAELASLLRRKTMESSIESLEGLIRHFVFEKEWPRILQEDARPAEHAANPSEGSIDKGSNVVAEMLSDMLKLNGVLILIDGLDEAAGERDQIESWIDKSTKTHNPLPLMVSTREYAFDTSREFGRLREFEAVIMQGLDKDMSKRLIEKRLKESPHMAEDFRTQLKSVGEQNPELTTSPFLLSLMIEVYKRKGSLPAQRVELYKEQVEGILSRCIARRVDNQQGGVHALGKAGSNDKALNLAIEYLEVCSFVCQMRREERDFKLAACSHDMKELWSHDVALLAETRALLFDDGLVGLLSRVDDETYRFSHLTLQEYLAARCTVRLYHHDIAELVKQLEPLHSRWRREVLQFTACMLGEDAVFTEFCQTVLGREDGAGAHCELVLAFLSERGDSEQVEQMLADAIFRLRGADDLVAGLCQPSPDVRELLLSEMRLFHMPPDPFADGGLVSALKKIADSALAAEITSGGAGPHVQQRGGQQGSSQLSHWAGEGGNTASESGDNADPFFDTVMAQHPGNAKDFQEHIRGFIEGFLAYMSAAAPETATQTFQVHLEGRSHEWSYCMLVWVRFAKDAIDLEESLRVKWLECIKVARQDRLLAMLDSCLRQESTGHKCWSRADFESLGCSKQFAAAIFVTDMVVRQSLSVHGETVKMWQQDVVKNWFGNEEGASVFLLRANRFLRNHVLDGISVMTTLKGGPFIETHSYGALMRMTKLASLLLFEYLEARKLECESVASVTDRSSLFHGFRMFSSSSGRVFSLTEASQIQLVEVSSKPGRHSW